MNVVVLILELHGRMILMEKAKSESTNTSGYIVGSGNSARNGRNSSQLQRTPHRSGANREKSDDATNPDKRKDSMVFFFKCFCISL